jgi:hypothetical protein
MRAPHPTPPAPFIRFHPPLVTFRALGSRPGPTLGSPAPPPTPHVQALDAVTDFPLAPTSSRATSSRGSTGGGGGLERLSSGGGGGSRRSLCSIDLSSLTPRLTASAIILRLGARPDCAEAAGEWPVGPRAPGAQQSIRGPRGSNRAASAASSTSASARATKTAEEEGEGGAMNAVGPDTAVAVRRHCRIAIVVVYLLTEEQMDEWEVRGSGGGGGGDTRVRRADFRGLPYNVLAGPLSAPPAIRAALAAAAVFYEQAYPGSAVEVWRELRQVALAGRRQVRRGGMGRRGAGLATARSGARRRGWTPMEGGTYEYRDVSRQVYGYLRARRAAHRGSPTVCECAAPATCPAPAVQQAPRRQAFVGGYGRTWRWQPLTQQQQQRHRGAERCGADETLGGARHQ